LNSAIEIAQILTVNDKISHLSLRRNALGDVGVKLIMKAVARSNSLVHLDLSSNSITFKGAKKVFKSLMVNQSLISLSLGSTDNVQKNKLGSKGI
jgi:Ran GTPase-activating protein (RanGAP) involved in mRNA processing and transport